MTQQETQQVGSIGNESLNFYGTVIKRLQDKDLYNILGQIKLQTDDEKIKLTNSQFETIGGISYLIGLDFISLNSWNKTVLKNVFMRLNLNKVSIKSFTRFKKLILKYNDFEIYNEAKENLMKRISDNIVTKDDEENQFINNSINLIIQSSLVPNNFAELAKDNFLANKDNYTYHDLLVFNNMFYENLIINKNAMNYFIDLSKRESYSSSLKLASEYFEDQKFGLMYLDSIVSLIQKINSVNIDNSWYFTDKLFEMCLDLRYDSEQNLADQIQSRLDLYEEEYNPKDEVEAKKVEAKPETEVEQAPLTNIIENLEVANINPLENPTEVVLQTFYEYNKICKETYDVVFDFKNKPEELRNLLVSLLTAEDIVGSFFIFLKKYAEFKNTEGVKVNEINVEEIFNYDRETLVEYLNTFIEELKQKYSEIISKYVIEVNNDHKEELVNKINELILALSVENMEDKSILMSQLSESIINTNKHLHEVLTCIDRQLISGYEIDRYIDLKDFLMTNFASELELFEETAHLEDYQLQVTLFTAFKNIF